QIPKVTVVDAVPGRLFSFRWLYPADEPAGPGNSLLVTFTLEPVDGGTRVRMVEAGWQDKDWTAEQLDSQFRDNSGGWDHFIARLGEYVARLAAAS
ncbi:polyketide cyclase, partial [cyanobacterium TDX16]